MIRTRTSCTASTLAIVTLSSIATAQAPTWEDHAFGDTFFVSDSTIADGVNVGFTCFEWTPPAGTTCNGHATVEDANLACGSGLDLHLNNINAKMDFAGTIGSQPDLQLMFGEYGGNLNIAINGHFVNFENFLDIHGALIGGVTVEVNTGGGGGDCGMLTLHGLTDALMIGGQELWIDWAEHEPDDCEYGFEEFTPGDNWVAGDLFTTSDGVPVSVWDFLLPGGGSTSGYAEIGTAGLACDTGNELQVNNVRTRFLDSSSFGGPGSKSYVDFKFGRYGGPINFAINGDLRIVGEFADLDGMTVGGALITIPYGGPVNTCGLCVIDGNVGALEVGGQELWIDCFNYEEDPNGGGNGECEDAYADYDDMTSATSFSVGSTTTTTGIAGPVAIEFLPQLFLDGTSYSFGSAVAQPVGLSCGDGMELQTCAISANHDFVGSIGTLVNVSVKVADHGGPINYGVNGSIVAADLYSDIDGITLGGCVLHVVSGGGVGECTELYIEGHVDNLILGGGQHMIDCIEAQDIIDAGVQGDLNGDGKVDGADLGLALAGWGTPSGDVNGDGNTDGADLGLILAAWSN